MKQIRRIFAHGLETLIGIGLVVLGCMEIVDSFWSGMGSALLAIGILRIIRIIRFEKDGNYRDKTKIEATDERNQFIRNKAWAWAGYFFLLIAAISTITLKLLGQDLLSIVAGSAVIILMLLYWMCYLVLRKKY